MRVAGVVLAGGDGRRLGGIDKAAITLGGRRTLEVAREALTGLPTSVVGPERRGGPAAALVAALQSMPTRPDAVVVLAVDMPYVTARTVSRLLAVDLEECDGAVLDDGHQQYLCAIYLVEALLAAAPRRPEGLSMRRLVEGLRLVAVPALGDEGHDLDTPADLARSRATPPSSSGVNLHDWIDELCDALDIEVEIDESLVLDVAKDAAHEVMRPAAPITTFLLGYALAEQGGSPAELERLSAAATDLAKRWDRPADEVETTDEQDGEDDDLDDLEVEED